MAKNSLGTWVHQISGTKDLRGDGSTESDMNSTLSGLKLKDPVPKINLIVLPMGTTKDPFRLFESFIL